MINEQEQSQVQTNEQNPSSTQTPETAQVLEFEDPQDNIELEEQEYSEINPQTQQIQAEINPQTQQIQAEDVDQDMKVEMKQQAKQQDLVPQKCEDSLNMIFNEQKLKIKCVA